MSARGRSKQEPTPVGTTRPEDERLSVGDSIVYGLQHILSMFGGVIAVPLIVGLSLIHI